MFTPLHFSPGILIMCALLQLLKHRALGKAPITLGTYFEGLPAYSRVLQIFEKPAENVQNRLRPLCTLIYAYCVRIYAYMYVLYVSIRI